jgi:hypothetical protein
MIPPVLQVLSAALVASNASLVPNGGKLNICATESDRRLKVHTTGEYEFRYASMD